MEKVKKEIDGDRLCSAIRRANDVLARLSNA